MGCHENISASKFPKQSRFLNCAVKVCFHYGSEEFDAVIVRDDKEAPYKTIFRLSDGRHVLATECQYTLPLVAVLAEDGDAP